MSKLWHSVGNGLWQLIPSVATLLLSLLIVRLYNTSVWGTIVSILVVQQLTNSVLAWGNKDFLQRELATNSSKFEELFISLLKQRFVLFLLLVPCLFFFEFIPKMYFFPLTLIIFSRFLQQSFDVIVLKEKKFKLVILLELVMVVAQIIALFILHHYYQIFSINQLLMIFWIPALLKGIFLTYVFRDYFAARASKEILLGKAFFFALLSLSGLIHSKIDLVLVAAFLDNDTLGKYQIIMAFLWNIQSVALYISSPYVPNFYRLNTISQDNYSAFLRRMGLLIVPISVGIMALLLIYAFTIKINLSILIAALLFGAMSFVYLPYIFLMNQQKKESRVLMINIFGTILLIVFILLTNTIWGLTLERMIWIITIQQLFITVVAFAIHKTRKV